MRDFASRHQTPETLPISNCQLPILRKGCLRVLIIGNWKSTIGNVVAAVISFELGQPSVSHLLVVWAAI